jgi:DNA-binding XRE family transcriptional regulator
MEDPVRIKKIYKTDNYKIYCLFSNDERRFIDFEKLFEEWKIQKDDIEYKLSDLSELHKVKLSNGTLSWDNVKLSLLDEKGKEKEYPYGIDPIVLYQNSKYDDEQIFENLGLLLKRERLKSGLTKKQLAKKSGISEEYITKLEQEKSNIELLIIRDILRNGFGKHLKINIE